VFPQSVSQHVCFLPKHNMFACNITTRVWYVYMLDVSFVCNDPYQSMALFWAHYKLWSADTSSKPNKHHQLWKRRPWDPEITKK